MAAFTNTAVFQYRNFFASPESGGVGGGSTEICMSDRRILW